MTIAAKTAFGAELWLCVGGGTLAKVAELINVTPPKVTRSLTEATSHDSSLGVIQRIPEGIWDPGEIGFSVFHVSNSAFDQLMRTNSRAGTLMDFKVVSKGASAAASETGSGYITSYGPDDLTVEGKQTASGTITVSTATALA